jgi:SAM-dependent methyltransferase
MHAAYSEYYDAESMRYRERFIYGPLLDGLDLDDKDVADLCCGAGATSQYLLSSFPRARTFGFDISSRACAEYRETLGRPAFEADLTRGASVDRRFDAAIVIGGIHHCVVDLPATLRTIADLLKPGGLLLMMEPSDEGLFAGARRFWYRFDRYFEADSEHALVHRALLAMAACDFSVVDVRHLGGPGYFLIFNSMIFRLPPSLKRALASPLSAIDALYNRLPGRFFYPYFVARWRRTGDPDEGEPPR